MNSLPEDEGMFQEDLVLLAMSELPGELPARANKETSRWDETQRMRILSKST